MASVLVVDDEAKLGRLIAESLEAAGHQVTRATGGRQGLSELGARAYDVVVTDLKMPEVDGLEVLRAARARPRPPEVVLITAFGTAQNAVEAMRLGAADYLTKPFSLDELGLRVGRLAAQRAAEATSGRLISSLTPSLVSHSPRMQELLTAARRVAATDATVLLLGESGTGKTQLARYIHFHSKRAPQALVEVQCAALPETLLESSLFGHERGAFTGATERRAGLLAEADCGTAFLDEIGEVSPGTQVKLLRFLQDRVVTPVGSNEARQLDVRLITATNRDLSAAVEAGGFREDFYYRLNVFSITLPPLRERPEDVLPLAEHFLRVRGLPPDKLSAAARRALAAHSWPGNVRELENALERALVFAGEAEIGLADLELQRARASGTAVSAAQVLGPGFNLDDFERQLLHAALERSGGNKTAAARLLGITRRRLYSRLQSLGEPEPEAPPGG